MVVGLAFALAVTSAIAFPARLPSGVPAAERARLARVVEEAVVSTSVRGEPFPARADLFEYLVDHPEFSAHVARTLRAGPYQIRQTEDGVFLDSGRGVTGHFWVVAAETGPGERGGRRVMYARGQYDRGLLPSIRGQAVVLLAWDTERDASGHSTISTSLTGYLTLDSSLLVLAGKLAAPIARVKADREARRLFKVFARTMSAIEGAPEEIYERLRQNPEVPSRELEEFRRILNLPAATMPVSRPRG
jgi:hypothetical protein